MNPVSYVAEKLKDMYDTRLEQNPDLKGAMGTENMIALIASRAHSRMEQGFYAYSCLNDAVTGEENPFNSVFDGDSLGEKVARFAYSLLPARRKVHVVESGL